MSDSSSYMIAIAIDIGGTGFKCSAWFKPRTAADDEAEARRALRELVSSKPMLSDRVDTGVDFTVEDAEKNASKFYARVAEAVHARSGASGGARNAADTLHGAYVGVSIPGLVDEAAGIVLFTPDVQLVGWQPAANAALARAARVRVLNDAEASVFRARQLVPAERHDDLVTLVVGTGIGAAYRVGGRRLGGASGFAGEPGLAPAWPPLRASSATHAPTAAEAYDGGSKGFVSWDDLGGGRPLVRRTGFPSGVELAAAAEAEDARPPCSCSTTATDDTVTLASGGRACGTCRRVIRQIEASGAALGALAALHVNLFNPRAIFVGGGVFRFKWYTEAAQASLKQTALAPLYKDMVFIVDPEPAATPAKGAVLAALSIEE